MPTNARVAFTQELLNRICGEYREMPGLGLKREQARRLWNLDEEVCGDLLDALVKARFLRRNPDGRYVRLGDGRD